MNSCFNNPPYRSIDSHHWYYSGVYSEETNTFSENAFMVDKTYK